MRCKDPNATTTPAVFDERDWSDTDYEDIGAWEKSMTLAERAAWEFVQRAE